MIKTLPEPRQRVFRRLHNAEGRTAIGVLLEQEGRIRRREAKNQKDYRPEPE